MNLLQDLTAKKPTAPPDSAPSSPGADLPGESFDVTQTDSPFSGVLKKIIEAELPGVSMQLADLTAESPVYGKFVQNPKAVIESGLGVYANKSAGTAAIFNPGVVSKQEVEKIDQAGKLDQFFPPASSILGGTHESPESPAPEATPPTSPVGGPPSPRARVAETRPIAQQRAQQIKSKPAGSAGGSILNDLLRKPV